MHEVEALERMVLDDATVHVGAAILAGVALDRRRLVDDVQLLLMRGDRQFGDRHDADDRKQGAVRLPALRAAAGMVVRDVAGDAGR